MTARLCPSCGHANSTQVMQCANCRAALDDTVAIAADIRDKLEQRIKDFDKQQALESQPSDKKPSPLPDIVKPPENKSQAMPPHDALPTTYLETVSDVELPIKFGRAYGRANLTLSDKDHGIEFSITAEELDEVIIGRENRLTGYRPKINLSPFSGHNLGVSRYHASIRWTNNVLLLTDHDSKNGTYLNGKRLVSQHARVIRNGDVIRVGTVNLLVKYQ
jgi:FHA domain-containing protein